FARVSWVSESPIYKSPSNKNWPPARARCGMDERVGLFSIRPQLLIHQEALSDISSKNDRGDLNRARQDDIEIVSAFHSKECARSKVDFSPQVSNRADFNDLAHQSRSSINRFPGFSCSRSTDSTSPF